MFFSLYKKCPLCRKIEKMSNISKDIIEINIFNDDICCICLENYDNNICQCNNCKNIFHINCIKNIKENNISSYDVLHINSTDEFINLNNQISNNFFTKLKICIYNILYIFYIFIISYIFFVIICYIISILHLLY